MNKIFNQNIKIIFDGYQFFKLYYNNISLNIPPITQSDVYNLNCNFTVNTPQKDMFKAVFLQMYYL